MASLHIVSNRTAADPQARAGGLAVALWDALTREGGSWIGWSGDIDDNAARGVRTQHEANVTFVLSDLTQDEHDDYYLGYANQVIWPVFHYRVDLANFEDDYFPAYAAVNSRFAQIVHQQAQNDDMVWVHDYHFLLMGEALRQEGWTGAAGFFLHIPFPPPDLYMAVPQHHRIARALCHYNVVGFQTTQDRNNFVRYLTDVCGGEDDGEVVRVFGREVVVNAYPIGIDPEAFAAAAASERACSAIKRISRFLGERDLVIGADRMDYSKGLPERFEAVGRLFDEYPEHREKVQMTQIAPPSRSKVDEYRELRKRLDELSGRINGDYGDIDWLPLRYLARSYDREELAGLFSIARVGLVTPLRDGMNLVAKEFVMAQDPDDPGVLILSVFAGAAERLEEALIVNPYDVGGLAAAIHRALQMPIDERRQRHAALAKRIRAEDISWWRRTFLAHLEEAALGGVARGS